MARAGPCALQIKKMVAALALKTNEMVASFTKATPALPYEEQRRLLKWHDTALGPLLTDEEKAIIPEGTLAFMSDGGGEGEIFGPAFSELVNDVFNTTELKLKHHPRSFARFAASRGSTRGSTGGNVKSAVSFHPTSHMVAQVAQAVRLALLRFQRGIRCTHYLGKYPFDSIYLRLLWREVAVLQGSSRRWDRHQNS